MKFVDSGHMWQPFNFSTLHSYDTYWAIWNWFIANIRCIIDSDVQLNIRQVNVAFGVYGLINMYCQRTNLTELHQTKLDLTGDSSSRDGGHRWLFNMYHRGHNMS